MRMRSPYDWFISTLKTILKYSRQEVNQINLSLIDKSDNIILESDHALIDVDLRIASYCWRQSYSALN